MIYNIINIIIKKENKIEILKKQYAIIKNKIYNEHLSLLVLKNLLKRI